MTALTQHQPLPRVGFAFLRLPILDSYLLQEMIGPFFFALGAFLLFWALNIFFLAADYIINQHAPFFLVLRFVVFRIPQATPMAFPFASLFAALLAMGRVMGDNEVTAMRTAGISVMRIALAPVLFGLGMFLISYSINEWVAPASVDLSTRTFYQIIYHTDALPVEPQVLRRSGRARQQDDARRTDLQACKIRPVERNASGEDRRRTRQCSEPARRD